MRRLVFALAAAAVGFAVACGGPPPHAGVSGKLIILGFDGLDPDLVERWMREGKLPHMAGLAGRGGLHHLETTHSPESPTAWASFATGMNAGKHNIYDFLVRDPQTYLPDLGMVHREPPRFLFGTFPIAAPRLTSTRGGTSFWVTAGEAGVRSSILTVPVTFPPEHVPNGELLSGLPLPDIRGTMGTFYYFATDLSRFEEGRTEFGGLVRRLVFDGNDAQAELVGPPHPIVRQQLAALGAPPGDTPAAAEARRALEAQADVRVPFSVTWNREARTANVQIQGQTIHLGEQQWSRWVELDFRINAFVRVRGMTQMYLATAGQALQLYIAPVNWHPERPPADISSPPSFARDLYQRLGHFRTLGWAEATWPLNEERLDEKTFMDDLYRAFDDRAQVILSRVDAANWDLLVGVIESPDRVQHMMWRLIDPQHPMYDAELARLYGDSIEQVYRRSDAFVGEVLARIDEDTTVLVVSDHGFHSFRYAVNLNTWLVQQGYMTLRGPGTGDKTLDDLFGGGTFWEHVDWSRTRAYAMGLGQIYVNQRGREGQGVVAAGAEYTALVDEIAAALLELRDPRTGATIVRNVYQRDDIYHGPHLDNAPDLQVGFESGYRTSWQTALGGAPPQLLEPNLRKWSGDHGAFDFETTAGVLISSVRLAEDAPRIIDIAPTVLRYFGLPVPADMDGRALFEAASPDTLKP
ncbi:MAG: alkaline phosphatase family protein [Vicinamibacterales bacterium]|nr:alkaline phosphatase family protein [Vicinamibacterales bacterium]